MRGGLQVMVQVMVQVVVQAVVQALTTHDDYRAVAAQLPDWPLADLPA